jgi:glutamate synthase domain-containing protein 1
MCGIAGYWEKSGDENTPVGCTLLRMLTALGCRGPDSTGAALYGHERPKHWRACVKLGESGNEAANGVRIADAAKDFGGECFERTDAYLRFSIAAQKDPAPFLADVESSGRDVEVVSLGRKLEILKQVGSPGNLERTFSISKFRGAHAFGHTRLSTESVVDLSHSQPFWAHQHPDLAIAHNGHITNYHQLRRRYEQHSTHFYTENDSEIVAIYLAKCLNQGDTLEAALKRMITDLDGSFSCIAATASEFGFVRDCFALKPLVFAETDKFVAIATEEIAIRAAIEGGYTVRETQAKEVRVWSR